MEKVLFCSLGSYHHEEVKGVLERSFEVVPLDGAPVRDVMPVDFAVISLGISLEDLKNGGNMGIEVYLEQFFALLKNMYAPFMRVKGGNIWVLEPVFEDPRPDSEITEVFSAGVKALTKIMALELARKKIVVNFAAPGDDGVAGLGSLLKWARKGGQVYLTGQTVN